MEATVWRPINDADLLPSAESCGIAVPRDRTT